MIGVRRVQVPVQLGGGTLGRHPGINGRFGTMEGASRHAFVQSRLR